jgi:hypothetical protein
MNNSYFELVELLPKLHTDAENTLTFTNDNQFTIKKKRSSVLSFTDWGEAFDVYASVHILKATSLNHSISLVKELLSYKKIIRNLMRQKYAWFEYDRHFRKEREAVTCPWSTVRFDLLAQYAVSPRAREPTSVPNASGPRPVPAGYCQRFHTASLACTYKDSCYYKHTCPRCSGPHPSYTQCNNTPYNRQTASSARHVTPTNQSGALVKYRGPQSQQGKPYNSFNKGYNHQN